MFVRVELVRHFDREVLRDLSVLPVLGAGVRGFVMRGDFDEDLRALIEWPTRAEDMTVDLLLRIVGCDTQRLWLAKMDAMEKDGSKSFASPLYGARTQAIIGAVGLMACLRALRDVSPERADAFVRDYWSMCDAGDSFGELLWEFTQAAGLNPELVRLPPEQPEGV